MGKVSRQVIIVLGMHRSGTSAITKSLELFGVALGDNLYPAGFDNPKGFWEDREYIEINEALLHHVGMHYNKFGFDIDRLCSDVFVSDLKLKAAQFITKKLSLNDRVWGFKDPRTCRLLPFWQDVFKQLQCDVKYVIALRNPISVAKSLFERDQIAVEKGYMLWLQHMLPAIVETQGYLRAVIDFDSLMEEPIEQLSRLAKTLSLTMPAPTDPDVLNYTNSFLDASLRHTKFSAETLDLDCRVPRDAITAYKLLTRVAQDDISLDSEECVNVFEKINARVRSLSPFCNYVSTLEDQQIKLQQQFQESCQQTEKFKSELLELDQKSNQQILEIDQKSNHQLNKLQSELQVKRSELDAMLNSTSWRLTKPIRIFGRSIKSVIHLVRRLISYYKVNGFIKTVKKCLAASSIETAGGEVMSNSSTISIERAAEFSNLTNEIFTYISNGRNTLLVTTHDLSRSGAPLVALNIVRELSSKHNFNILVITMLGGDLLPEFEQYSYVLDLGQQQINHIDSPDYIDQLFNTFSDFSISKAILSTTGGMLYIPYLEKYGFDYQILIHEMPQLIQSLGWNTSAMPLADKIEHGRLIFSSAFVKNKHVEQFRFQGPSAIIHQGRLQTHQPFNKENSKRKLRERLGIPLDAQIVLGAGKDFYRKGVDLFYEISQKVVNKLPKCYFVFLGDKKDPWLTDFLLNRSDERVLFLDFQDDYTLFLEGADVFALTSREDPLPNVFIDALSFGLPVIAFEDCGGAAEILKAIHERLVAEKFDLDLYCNQLIYFLLNQELAGEVSNKLVKLVNEKYQFSSYVDKLLHYFKPVAYRPYFVKDQPSNSFNKVLHVIANFNVGGSSQLVIDLVERLENFSHHIITQYLPHPQKYLGVNIEQVDLNSVEKFKESLARINPSIIHVHYWGRGDAIWYEKIYEILEKVDIPVIQNINVPVDPLISKINLNYIYVSNYVKNHFKSNSPDKEMVIYPGSDFSVFNSSYEKPDGPVYVGMVYRLDVDKVNERSIEPFLEIAKLDESKKIKFLIIGEGALLPLYKRRVEEKNLEDRFVFTGEVAYSELPSLYAKLHVFIAPVFDESFGQVVPFAMNFGIPVVGYDTGAIGEIIDDPRLLAPTGDAKKLAKIVNQLLSNPDFIAEVSQRNQLRAKEYFSIEQMIAAYQKLYSNIAKKIKPNILLVALNPSAQEGGGADVLWPQVAISLLEEGYQVGICVCNEHTLAHKVQELKNRGGQIYYHHSNRSDLFDSFSPSLVVLVQGDHNEGRQWFGQCQYRNIPYVIVNQLTKEASWPDNDLAQAVKHGYSKAYKAMFTCENNRLLLERQIGVQLKNAERHFNPVMNIPINVDLPFPSSEQGFFVACPARLIIIHKGQDLLFEIMKQEKWKSRNLNINLYGDGPDKDHLCQLKKNYQIEQIRLCPYQDDIKDIWRVNHGIILPSRMEGVPIVLLGAMLCARVPILTDIGGHRELVTDGVSGFIANTPSVAALDDALEMAWQQRHEWEKIGQLARQSVLDFMPEDPVRDFISKIIPMKVDSVHS